jgi:capsule polysaccharide export protein KpsC/LpsZ
VFDLTDWGITIRGSVGFELPCLGVPVLTAGTGYYAGRGFTVDSATADEYLGRLRAIQEIPPLTQEQVELARRHAYGLFVLRPTRFTSFRSIIPSAHHTGSALDHDLVVTVRSASELRAADDLHRFASWAVESSDLDYLNPPAAH